MKRKHWCILIVYKSDLLALQVLLSDLLEEFVNAFASQRRSLMVQTIVLLNRLERPLLLGNLAFLLQILLIADQTQLNPKVHSSMPSALTFSSSSPSQQSMPLKLSGSVKSNTSRAISASRQYRGMIDLKRSSPAVSQMLSWISSPVLVFIFFYWYAPASVGSCTFLKTPSLQRIVMDVFPTAALPQSTSFTAFLAALGFCRILFLPGSLLGFYFFAQSHIRNILHHTKHLIYTNNDAQILEMQTQFSNAEIMQCTTTGITTLKTSLDVLTIRLYCSFP